MFDSVRKHQKILQIVLMLFIVPSFMMFGISSYSGFMDKETDLIKVNGNAITTQEVEASAKRQADRIGGNPQITQSVAFRKAVLDELLQQRLLGFAVKDLRLRISQDTLVKSLQNIPQIRALYKTDGSFDNDRFKQLLASNGMNEDQFYASQNFDLQIQQLINSVVRTEISNTKLFEAVSSLYETERQIQTLKFTATDYLSKVKPSAEELESFYKENANLFESPEVIDIEYLVLKADSKEDAKAFNEKADQFANLTYDQADSLKPAADKLKLTIQTQKGITRSGLSGVPKDHPLTNPRVIQSLFSDDSLKNKRNIEAVQSSPGVYISARVVGFHPASTLPFKEVAEEVKRQVSLRAAEKLASNAASERYSALQKDPSSSSGFSPAFWVSRNKPADIVGATLDEIMAVNPAKFPVAISVSNAGSGTTLYLISQIREPMVRDEKIHKAQAQQMQAFNAEQEFAAFMAHWRDVAGVKVINPIKSSSQSSATN